MQKEHLCTPSSNSHRGKLNDRVTNQPRTNTSANHLRVRDPLGSELRSRRVIGRCCGRSTAYATSAGGGMLRSNPTPTASGEASTTDDDDPVSLCSSSSWQDAVFLLAPAATAGGAPAEEDDAGGKEDKAAAVSCSICLDAVLAGAGERSTARLHCGHEFHLDCIGSAFNAKGVMQCPNCRKIEKGNWLYANGSRSAHDVSMDEWAHDEDLYDVSYSDVPLRFHWCPFGRLAQLPSLFEEGESSPPITFHDFMGQHVFTEQVAVSAAPGTTHPCPYVAYLHPLPPLTSSSSSHVPERTMDRPAYHDHWNPMAGPSDVRPMQTMQPADFHHSHWAHVPHSYAQPNSNNEQPGIPFGTRAARVDGDSQRRSSVVSPSYFSNGSGSRSRPPSVPPLMPQFMRAHGSINEQYQQNSSSSLFAGAHRSGGMRPAPTPLPENPTFSLFPPGSSGHSSMETDDVGGSRFYAWERDRFAPYPLMPVDCETSWWTSQQQSHSTSEPTSAPRRLFGQWLGVGRSSPENRSPEGSSYRQMHSPRM